MVDDTVRRLFIAENARDWNTLAGLLDTDVTWQLNADETTVIKGRNKYLDRLQAAYEARPSTQFEVVSWRDTGRGRILCELMDDLGEASVEVFDVRDGLVIREWEFIFGPDER